MNLTKLTTAKELNELAKTIKEMAKELDKNPNLHCLQILGVAGGSGPDTDLSLDISIKVRVKHKSTDWEELIKILEEK